jgi:16S rRNA (cytosine967-C5)-methyltransferase
MIKKTLRSLKLTTPPKTEILLFVTYRFMFERAKAQDIMMEVNQNEELSLFLGRLKDFSWDVALKDKNEVEVLSIYEAIPSFFIERLLPVMKLSFLKDNITSMNDYNSQKTVTLRINSLTSNISIETLKTLIKSEFQKKGIPLQQDKEISYILYTQARYKRAILKSKYYNNYTLIFQDRASVVIAELLRPQQGEFICDLCAAPGIKSSIILQLSDNRSRILCNDFSNSRLRFTKNFFHRLKALDISFLNSDGTCFPMKNDIKFDKILIDAPCTGSGTFLSHPELKWRQNNAFLNQNVVIQKKLIESGLNLLKKGGILVYSTCSLYPEEGEYQINEIYDQITPLNLPKYFSKCYKINNIILKGTGRLFPSIHNTQGFFVSRLKKK